MRKVYLFSVFAFCLAIMGSCSGPNPEEELSPAEKDVYVTNYDPEANFSAFKTFTLPDSVYVITDPTSEGTKERQPIDVSILNTIKEEMERLGYILVAQTESPDLGVQVTKVALSYTGIDYTPRYYYDPYYGGGYYYPSYYVYQIRRGSVMVDLVDLKSPRNNELKVIWNGQYIDGLGSLSSDERILTGVRSLFTQSTYLNRAQ